MLLFIVSDSNVVADRKNTEEDPHEGVHDTNLNML